MFIINHYAGFGDNIYHIPFVHQLAKQGTVYIYTPFPELFQFENVVCLPHPNAHRLKLQKKNGTANPLYAKNAEPHGRLLRFEYGSQIRGTTLIKSFERTVPLKEWFFEFNPQRFKEVDDIRARADASGKKLCVVRLPSVRDEWPCSSRNGKMEYFKACIDHLKDRYCFVTVGDIGNNEAYDGPCPDGIDDHRDRAGDRSLTIWQAMDLINRSDLVLAIQSNILPICQMLKKRSFFIYGGYVPHRALNDDRLFQVGYAEPDPFCFCVDGQHRCRKEIKAEILIERLNECLN